MQTDPRSVYSVHMTTKEGLFMYAGMTVGLALILLARWCFIAFWTWILA